MPFRVVGMKNDTLHSRARFIFLLMVICYFLPSFHRALFGTLGGDIAEDFAVGGGLVSLMAAALFYPYTIMQVIAGILADRWGSRRTVTIALVITSAGTLLLATANTVPVVCIGRVLTGIGAGMLYIPGLRLVENWFPKHMHAFWTALFLSLGTCGMFLASWPLRILSNFSGWRTALILVSCITLGLAVLGGLFLRNSPADAGLCTEHADEVSVRTKKAAIPLGRIVPTVLKSRTYWCIAVWLFCMFGVYYAFIGLWAGTYLNAYGLDNERAALILAAISIGAIIGPTLYGSFISWFRVSNRAVMHFAGIGGLMMVAVMVIPAQVMPYWLLPVWGFLLSIFLGSAGTFGLLEVQDAFPEEIAGTVAGMINLYTALGAAMVQNISGGIMELLAPDGVYDITDFSSMSILFVVLILAGCVSLFLCPKSARK